MNGVGRGQSFPILPDTLHYSPGGTNWPCVYHLFFHLVLQISLFSGHPDSPSAVLSPGMQEYLMLTLPSFKILRPGFPHFIVLLVVLPLHSGNWESCAFTVKPTESSGFLIYTGLLLCSDNVEGSNCSHSHRFL